MVRFGILGAGRIGKVHARTIADSGKAQVALVADAMADAASSLAASVGGQVASVEQVLASDVDAILIATPTDTHADLIEQAARAGKAILCEKPVSLSVARIEQCLPVVEKAGVPLMIGFNRRFDPNFAALQKRLMQLQTRPLTLRPQTQHFSGSCLGLLFSACWEVHWVEAHLAMTFD